MPSLRLVALLAGLGAALLGVLGPLYGLLTAPSDVAAKFGGGSNVLVWGATVAAIAIGTLSDVLFPEPMGGEFGTAILWCAIGLLWVLVVMPYPAVNVYLVPSALLALVAGVTDLWDRISEATSHQAQS
jgi:hypothetical protein